MNTLLQQQQQQQEQQQRQQRQLLELEQRDEPSQAPRSRSSSQQATVHIFGDDGSSVSTQALLVHDYSTPAVSQDRLDLEEDSVAAVPANPSHSCVNRAGA